MSHFLNYSKLNFENLAESVYDEMRADLSLPVIFNPSLSFEWSARGKILDSVIGWFSQIITTGPQGAEKHQMKVQVDGGGGGMRSKAKTSSFSKLS